VLYRTVVLGMWANSDDSDTTGSVTFLLAPELVDLTGGETVPSKPVIAGLLAGVLVQDLVANDAPGSELSTTTSQYFVTEEVTGSPSASYWISVPSEPPGSRTVADAVVVNGSNLVTSATAAFTSGDVGAYVFTPEIPTPARILAVVNSTTAQLSQSAVASGSAQTLVVGASATLASLRPG
jgi:hypothetical protein